MTNEAFTEVLTFTRCQNWSTEACPYLTTSHMQLSTVQFFCFPLASQKRNY